MIAQIPFSGFYESVHDAWLTTAFEQIFHDDQGNDAWNLLDRAYMKVSFKKAFKFYADYYATAFCENFNIAGKFESLSSPREYNFSTDRIFIELPESEVTRLFDLVDKTILADVCRGEFTSYDGFHSFYDPDFTTWGEVTSLDHNQLYALIVAFCGDVDEAGIMEDAYCNGYVETWILEGNKEVTRLANIASYLRSRTERKYRVQS